MIATGNALAPRWYDRDPAELGRFLDFVQKAGATSMELVLHPGELAAGKGDVQIPESKWETITSAIHERSMSLSVHAPLDPELSLRRWHSDRPRLEQTYVRLLRYTAHLATAQQTPLPIVVHASRSRFRNETENAADTIDFLHWALDITAHEPLVRFALELRDAPDATTRWFDTDRFTLLRLVRNVESDRVGICWDMGHDWQNFVRAGERLEPPEPAFMQRVIHVHAHDGLPDLTVHHPIGTGGIPVQPWLNTLKSSGYVGQLTLEIRYRHARQVGNPWQVLANSYEKVLQMLDPSQPPGGVEEPTS